MTLVLAAAAIVGMAIEVLPSTMGSAVGLVRVIAISPVPPLKSFAVLAGFGVGAMLSMVTVNVAASPGSPE